MVFMMQEARTIANDLKEDIGKSGQLLYMDGKASVYGTLQKVKGCLLIFKPGAHLTFKEGIYSMNPDFEGLIERLNCNQIIRSWSFNIRDFAKFDENMARYLGFDIRDAPNIQKPLLM